MSMQPFIHSNDHAMGNLGYARNNADFYPTPEWVTRAVLPALHRHGFGPDVWEPAAGNGAMVKVLRERFSVFASDINNYDNPDADMLYDFLTPKDANDHTTMSVCTNPPYGDLAEAFIRKALAVTQKHQRPVAMLLRNEYDCAKGRNDLFSKAPFAEKIVLTTRPRWIEGSTGAPRHNYAWFIWNWKHKGSPIISYAGA